MKDTRIYNGAWLTDIDDTLLPSGEKPSDEMIAFIAHFITILKQFNILWVPVSGVAIAKMGPRLLYRLPSDVLSHVIYYGGEGSTKNQFDESSQSWTSDTSFQRHFDDAQAIALIGKERLTLALQDIMKKEPQENTVQERLQLAETTLKNAQFNQPALIDEMESLLEKHDFNKSGAETYFRGGALSWMMLGDQSVEAYKGESETATRMQIRDFAQSWLEQNNNLRHLGESGAHMPYKHATRGIKVVMEGNDKARAAEDLMQSYHIPAEAILFVGNELFDGGNDNSVRRVDNVRILSVGENEDPGVIDGGVQVGANQQWMTWITEQKLQQGDDWDEILEMLPSQAELIRLTTKIDSEKKRKSNLSDMHDQFSPLISSAELAAVMLKHRSVLENTRHALLTLRSFEYQLLSRLSVLNDYHYDEARKMVRGLVADNLKREQGSKDSDCLIAEKIKLFLLPELKEIIKKNYIDQLNIPIHLIDNYIDRIKHLSDVLPTLDKLFINTPLIDYSAEKSRAKVLVKNWESRIEGLSKDWFEYLENWQQKKKVEKKALFSEQSLSQLAKSISTQEIYHYFCRITPRLFDFPHLKELDKPTIILVAGTSGVGKSTISQHISKTMGISTYFSTDVTSRSVMRESFKFMMGDKAPELFPELYGSSFDEDSLSWFYSQSLLGMMGTSGSIDRLVKENVSAVIDGVSLIPGTLADRYFEIANIVWIVACIDNEEVHYQRMGTRNETGVSRGGAERYRKKIKTIRNNHNRLVTMGKRAKAYIADNSATLPLTLDQILLHIQTPFSDKGLPIKDKLRDESCRVLNRRMSDIANLKGLL